MHPAVSPGPRGLLVRASVTMVALLVATGGALVVPHQDARATVQSSGGWNSNARPANASVARGARISITVDVRPTSARDALVDVEIASPSGAHVHQQFWDAQAFQAGVRRSFTTTWTVPGGAATGRYIVKVGLFTPGWGTLQHWNNDGGTFTVTSATAPPTTAPPTTAPPTTAPPTSRFVTLPVGAALPSDATCASRVRRGAPEVRSMNTSYNQTRGSATAAEPGLARYARVTGDFTGTTDEIIQWGACKWGIDEDILRAQMAKESWWDQRSAGDFTSDPNDCAPRHPIGADGRPGQCPESVGLAQVRTPYFRATIARAEASTAYNVDVYLAVWRTCFEGEERWLNDVDRGQQYVAGDQWGCIGRWFSGRWYTQPAKDYIAAVQDYLNRRIWQTPEFLGYR